MDNSTRDYDDYKYYMDDMNYLRIGSRYSYEEMADDEEMSYKYRCIIKRFIEQEVSADTTLESHFYYMKEDSQSYAVYDRLKTKIRCYKPRKKKLLRGGYETIYGEELYLLKNLIALTPEQKKNMGLMIAEIQIPKIALMSFAM